MAASSAAPATKHTRPAPAAAEIPAGGYEFSFDTLLAEAKRLASKPYTPQRSTFPAESRIGTARDKNVR